MKKLLILIPSYKRPQVLDLTLDSLIAVHGPAWNVTVAVADNKWSSETHQVLYDHIEKFKAAGIDYHFECNADNIGKARALNGLMVFDNFEPDVIVTMDNDMVLHKPWYWLVHEFVNSPYDFIGVASPKWWWHLPLTREECTFEDCGAVRVYKPGGIAGGLLMFKPEFLRAHKWTNKGGVYGVDDGLMNLKTQNRAVFYWEKDWLEHDPLSYGPNPPPDLLKYLKKKEALNVAGVQVFPEGWDE